VGSLLGPLGAVVSVGSLLGPLGEVVVVPPVSDDDESPHAV